MSQDHRAQLGSLWPGLGGHSVTGKFSRSDTSVSYGEQGLGGRVWGRGGTDSSVRSWHCRPGQDTCPHHTDPSAGHADLMSEERPVLPALPSRKQPSGAFLRPPSGASAEGDTINLWVAWASLPGALQEETQGALCGKGAEGEPTPQKETGRV